MRKKKKELSNAFRGGVLYSINLRLLQCALLGKGGTVGTILRADWAMQQLLHADQAYPLTNYSNG